MVTRSVTGAQEGQGLCPLEDGSDRGVCAAVPIYRIPFVLLYPFSVVCWENFLAEKQAPKSFVS